ncbi:MAG TPA: cytochrome b5-like heme/steroid binding domain-containing protein, partial [Vicinamibacterales bacterium]|nr:cytochrome b5-like heme/steroid binding domain-containing protein [Vicinamibacterales bacterium]
GPGVLGSGEYDASDVALHNDDDHGYWTVINGSVHDVTEFRHLHPGGSNIMVASAGMDATDEYETVLHHENAEIDAMLSMYKIGTIRRLDFSGAWGIALAAGDLTYVSLHDLFRAWVRFLYLVVEMQNAFSNDVLYLQAQTTVEEQPDELTGLKLMMFGNTHARFMELYFRGLLGAPLHDLWALTAGLCAPHESSLWMRDTTEELDASPGSQRLRALEVKLRALYREARTGDEAFWERAGQVCATVVEHDRRFLRDVKTSIRAGVRAFERHEHRTLVEGREVILDALRRVPAVADDFQAALASELDALSL